MATKKMLRADGTMRICLIKPGWGSSGFYPAEVLRRDGPRIFPANTHMYVNHPSRTEETDRPERDVRDLWSVTTTEAAYLDSGPKGPGLYADVKVLPAFAPYAEALAPHIGCSIRAMGRATPGERDGRKGPIIEALVAGRSVDWVTVPGAGGGAVELFEAARTGAPFTGAPPPEGSRPVDETELKNLREAMAGTERERDELLTENGRLKEALLMHEVTSIVSEELARIDLSDVTRERLTESLPRRAPIQNGALDADAYRQQIREAVRAEVEYLAKATGVGLGKIRGMGAPLQEAEERRAIQSDQEAGFARLFPDPERAKTAAAGRR
jgi:hypothetical protein